MIEFFVALMLCDDEANCRVFAQDMQWHQSLSECLELNNAYLYRAIEREQITPAEDDRGYVAICVEIINGNR